MAPLQSIPKSPQYLNSYPSIFRSSSTSSNGTYHLATSGDYTRVYRRSVSPSTPDLRAYGYQNENGSWTCAYPGCASKAVFTRGCDLRKHHKRHTKGYFCSHESCLQSTGGGFSRKTDLARHMASHQPSIVCEWDGCERVFSRVDSMVCGAIVVSWNVANEFFRGFTLRGYT
ncbi:hypothetical protein EJ05DRAFT_471403 [Pseudovirgaria hyperparasitica]|uniref:C2H2-type domain-containing protein n=1 Tax=Pseudovirgaria hyperparasitica TaxID=470096 RepID=A0A6A6VP36_9PEZI|nr:uncharacterized protein EJ05DRAFT_471403 [Pseudovirgaria hyperparasitica]KAF2752392.1 hypothetical protein EJ05DRAFT_471403 [Pseudovirgaria hyperparasitica]